LLVGISVRNFASLTHVIFKVLPEKKNKFYSS
jgi:hypothetical protein